jgi:hypothetical protein
MGVCKFSKLKFSEVLNIFNNLNIDVIELGDQAVEVGNEWSKTQRFRHENLNRFKSWRTLDLSITEGVEKFDLSILSDEKNCADLITNFGTSEHVEFETGQYNCWVNTHNFLRINGIALHIVPPPGSWPAHCRYYYDESFFINFENYGYQILEISRTYNELILCTMKKIKDVEFMSYDEFFKFVKFVNIGSDKIAKTNNPKNLTW